MVEGIVTMAVYIIVFVLCAAAAVLIYLIASALINRHCLRKRQIDKLKAEIACLKQLLKSEREINRQIREDYYAAEK